ncbi:hypothetical protein M8J77_013970 [Diaphorina citri]|nr:hypothetical protein M8J77_013970 [Diaphorina citri]
MHRGGGNVVARHPAKPVRKGKGMRVVKEEDHSSGDDDARKRTEEGEGYSGIPVCREFPNENPNIIDSLAYSTLVSSEKSAGCNFQE